MARFVARFKVTQEEPAGDKGGVHVVTAYRTRVGDMKASRWDYLFELGGVTLTNEVGTVRLRDRKGRVFLMNNSLDTNDWQKDD